MPTNLSIGPVLSAQNDPRHNTVSTTLPIGACFLLQNAVHQPIHRANAIKLCPPTLLYGQCSLFRMILVTAKCPSTFPWGRCLNTVSTHLAIRRQLTTPAHSHPEAHDVVAVPPVCPSPVAPQPPPAAGTLGKTLEARQPFLLQGPVPSVPVLALLVRRVAVAYRVDPHPVATYPQGEMTRYVKRGGDLASVPVLIHLFRTITFAYTAQPHPVATC